MAAARHQHSRRPDSWTALAGDLNGPGSAIGESFTARLAADVVSVHGMDS
ncbi:hypothetical protein GCM10010309_26180 [Streptomyces violaceochromogenes]|nr:hypothetical protein GCM10010309_26180 [Streptomyces violaceochromogenes]